MISSAVEAAVTSMPVKMFAAEWLHHRIMRPPAIPQISQYGGVTGAVIYRRAPFQVELFIAQPGGTAPRHTHPNVDSVEVLISGAMDFDSDRNAFDGELLHVAPGEEHVAVAGAQGSCFYSFQKWLNGVEPTSVTNDWVGAPIDQAHAHVLAST